MLKSSVFECLEDKCKRLVINKGVSVFAPEGKQRICQQCVIANEQCPEEKLEDEALKDCLSNEIKKGIKRMVNFGELKNSKKAKFIAVLSKRGKLDLNISIFVKEEVKTFLVRINEQIL